ncbi:MAG: glycosyltransferase family 4 protein [Flavobacterium sp.]|nr:glycosyltransferase family 4 protein [Flavobacterium sp.]
MNRKIAILCNYELLPERVGGMDYFFWLFDQKCKSDGYEVDWFFPNISNHGGYKKLNVISSDYQNSEVFFIAYQQKSKTEYSHIFTHFVELCTPSFRKIKQVSDAKIIAVDHNPRPLNGYPLQKKIEKRIKGMLYSKYTDLFVGVSNYTVNQIINDFGKHLRKKAVTIYNGVVTDAIVMRISRNEKQPSFIVASHLRESKGIQDLIAAVAQLSETLQSELKIDIYGDGPYKTQLQNLVQKCNGENIFSFKGSQPNLNEIYCQYDYLLQPTHMECFSLSILESLAANVPVITTNVGGNEEVIKNGSNGYIFEAGNSTSLKEIIENVYSGKQKIEVNTSHLIHNEFSLDKMVGHYMELLSNANLLSR